jgi:hypothetical protein
VSPIEPRSSADRVYDALKLAHLSFSGEAEREADLPAWYVLTSAGAIRIKTVGTFEPFVKFVTPDGQLLLVPPEAVVVTMQKLAPESEEERFPIGFG